MDGVRTAAGWVSELQGRWLGSCSSLQTSGAGAFHSWRGHVAQRRNRFSRLARCAAGDGARRNFP